MFVIIKADIFSNFYFYQWEKICRNKWGTYTNEGAVLNPCPPFYRGEEVSADVIDSEYFVGYEFKKCLMEVQQAIMIWCLAKIGGIKP